MALQFGDALSGIGSAFNIASGIGSMVQNRRFFKQRLQFDKEQNELNRQYNLNLAKQQNQWSIDQWNRENNYNTPAAQRLRMAQAGLNPDLVYGNGAGQSLAASSPGMTAGSPSNPTSSDAFGMRKTIGELFAESAVAGESLSNIALNQAGSRNTNQSTDNLKIEGNILTVDSLTRAAQNEQSIALGKSQVYLNHSVASLNHSEKELVSKNINLAVASYDRLQEEIRNLVTSRESMQVDQMKNRYEIYARSRELEMAARSLANQTQMTQAQCKDILTTLIPRVLNISADTHLKGKQSVQTSESTTTEIYKRLGLDLTNKQMLLNLDSDKDFKSIERTTGIVTKVIDTISGAIGRIFNAVK